MGITTYPDIGTDEWNELASTHLYNFSSGMPIDQWSKQYPTLNWLLSDKMSLDSSATMAWNIADTATSVGATYTGWQGISLTDEHTNTKATQAIGRYAEPIMIAKSDADETGGGGALFDLLEFKTSQRKKALVKKHSSILWGAAATGAFTTIPLAIPVDPTASVVFNGVNGASGQITSWRNKTQTATGSWSSSGIDKLDALLNEMAEETTPDLLVTTKTVFGFMQKNGRGYIQAGTSLTSKSGKQMLDLGIPVMSFNGIPVVHDPDCTTGCIYALTRGAIKWCSTPDGNYDILKPGFQTTHITGSIGSVALMHLAGNLRVNERRALGRVDTITSA